MEEQKAQTSKGGIDVFKMVDDGLNPQQIKETVKKLEGKGYTLDPIVKEKYNLYCVN
jgi:hypothetical protein